MLRKKTVLKIYLYLILQILVLGVICNAQTDKESKTLTSFKPIGKLEEEKLFGPYVIRIYNGEDWVTVGSKDCFSSFEVLRNNVRVYAKYGGSRGFGIYEKSGLDIIGNGQPDLVIFEINGGYHPYYSYHIFEIGNQFRYIETLSGRGGGNLYNADNDHALEFEFDDTVFAYWRASWADSPFLKVIYKYRGTKYEVACELMRKPALSNGEFKRLAKRLAAELKPLPDWVNDHHYRPPPNLWTEMLNLMYTGNMSQVWELAELSWPVGTKGKRKFLKDFREKMEYTVFWNKCVKKD